MANNSVPQYNQYNLRSYENNYPTHEAAKTAVSKTSSNYSTSSQLTQQPDTISFSANKEKERKKQDLSTSAKLTISAGIATAFAIGADFIFCKGKHVKKIFDKIRGKGSSTATGDSALNPTKKIPKDKLREHIIDKYKFANKDFYKQKPMMMYSNALKENYNQVRICSEDFYQLSPTSTKNIAKITRANSKNVYVISENGWHYRIANKNKNHRAKVIERISLNVSPEESLIKELDDFISKTHVNVEYKTPTSFDGWRKRHDPITMYFREPIPQDVKDEIIKIVSPHVRNCKQNVMLGTKLADGIYQIPEPTEKQVLELIKRAENLGDDKLIECLQSPDMMYGGGLYQYSGGNVKVKTSPGLVKAVEMLLDDLERLSCK